MDHPSNKFPASPGLVGRLHQAGHRPHWLREDLFQGGSLGNFKFRYLRDPHPRLPKGLRGQEDPLPRLDHHQDSPQEHSGWEDLQ